MRVLVLGGTLSAIREYLPDDLFGFYSRVVGCGQGNVVWQPDVEIEPILNVFRKKLLLEMGSNEGTNHQKDEGTKQDAPAVRDRATDKSVVKAVKAPLPLLLDTELFLFGWPLNVVTQEWNKRHGNNERTQQRSSHHDRKGSEELTGIACQHQERKIGDDVRDCGKEDRGCQFRRSEPRRNADRKTLGETALDSIPPD